MNEYQITKELEILVGNRKNAARIKELRAELQSLLTDGAQPCPDCGNTPHGIRQARVYEIGCLVCQNKRSFGKISYEAVENWNAGRLYTNAAAYAVENG